ncbi:hypothetical protein FOMPIDRAFT_1051333 [Fomitopsis schrenkii]|uniref:Uncharacterized protein n=1 Tax=Fomitopsis schrenkii TaxID=2126942 RepID=S8FK64_FOMSC|nr:hypothetical protein FOMPIDRAFT_1051333 [Fomitopsis schrenkii]
MLTFRALLDFIYLAQYPTHDNTTLKYMTDALELFHKHKDVLKELGICEHMNIPKLLVHSLLHYVDSIRNLGTTNNHNTEMFKRLHIDCAKKVWRAMNHRDECPQMVKWLEHREKVSIFEMLCKRLAEASGQLIRLTQSPQDRHPAAKASLHQATKHHPTYLPFSRLNIFHGIKFPQVPLSDNAPERDAVKAKPASGSQPAWFDTVVMMQGNDDKAPGLQGTWIGCVKVIFRLPDKITEYGSNITMPAPDEWAEHGPLAYVEWFAMLPTSADPIHMMYNVRKMPLHADGNPAGEVLPLATIWQSCQLIP